MLDRRLELPHGGKIQLAADLNRRNIGVDPQVTDPVRFREFIYSLTQRLSRAGISSIMTSEVADLFQIGRFAEYGISHLADNVILVQYVRAESRLLRGGGPQSRGSVTTPRSANSRSLRTG